jgi:hypothetical protein
MEGDELSVRRWQDDAGWSLYVQFRNDLVESSTIAKAPAWKIKPAKKLRGKWLIDPGVREDLWDNYFRAALSVALAGNKFKSSPVVAWAAFNKHEYTGLEDEIAVIRFLLWAGFNPNVPDEGNNYPMHFMAFFKHGSGSHPRAIRLLLKAGANPNLRRSNGDSPLTYLCAATRLTDDMLLSAERMLEGGADWNQKSYDGVSPKSLVEENLTWGKSQKARLLGVAARTVRNANSQPAGMAFQQGSAPAGESPVVKALRGMLAKFSQQYPGYWKHAQIIRTAAKTIRTAAKDSTAAHATMPWCFASSTVWGLIHYSYGKGKGKLEEFQKGMIENAEKSFVPAFLGTWRFTQGVYQFDPDLYANVIDTPVLNDYPREALCHLPEWAVFIETTSLTVPGTNYPVHGVGLHLDVDQTDGLPLPVFTLFAQHPDGVWSMPAVRVGASADYLTIIGTSSKDDQTREAWRECAGRLLSLALWLSSEQPEIEGEGQPSRPAQYKSGSKGERFHASDTTRTWEVGVRIGAALRQAKTQQVAASNENTETSQRSKYRGHVRRAHWHKYHYGKGRTNVRVRWVSHMLINMTSEGALPTTIHAVQPANDPAITATKGEAA